jgi:hypothetical protein
VVVFCWPEAQIGWRQIFPWAAVIPGLLAGFMIDVSLHFRRYTLAAWLLALRLPRVREQLRSLNASERAQAARSIGRMARFGSSAHLDLIEVLRDPSADVRLQALLAIGAQRSIPAERGAIQPLLSDADIRVRIVAAGVLMALDPESVEVSEVLLILIDGPAHSDRDVAAAAQYGLAQIPESSLRDALASTNEELRRAAAKVLDDRDKEKSTPQSEAGDGGENG